MPLSKDGLILMTALPPTRGHQALIEFGLEYLKAINEGPDGILYVLINTRDCEPIPGETRVDALMETFSQTRNIRFFQFHGDVPQNPSEHPDFWNYWKNLIGSKIHLNEGDLLFASEPYGIPLAQIMKLEFVPFDPGREVVDCSGTRVRNDPFRYIADVLPTMQPYFRRTVTFFGAESTGKTTATIDFSNIYRTPYLPEYARPYLEMVGPEITDAKMVAIENGQYALQQSSIHLRDAALLLQDTDLLSTIGYWEIFKGRGKFPVSLENKFLRTKSDLYIVMNDGIPFEPDPLRYGGDKREAGTDYWVDLLNRYECKYEIVKSTDRREQIREISMMIEKYKASQFRELRKFVRT